MANDTLEILLPPGRIIMGDVYVGSDTDSKGQPRIVKTGANKGQQYKQYFIGVAIPKNPGEQAWWQTDWGQKIMAVGAAGHPNFYQGRAFAWKIDDGDSAEVNKSGKRICDAEGAKGNWILKFSSQFAPSVHQQPTPGVFQQVTTPGLIKKGWWVQVFATVKPNTGESPGIYLNQSMVLFVRQDTEITSGPDAATAFAGAGVGQALPSVAALPFAGGGMGVPAGMPAMGHPGMAQMPAMGHPGMAQMPAMGMPAMGMPAGPAMGHPGMAQMPAMGMPAGPVMVQPNPGFLAVPGMPAAPGAPGMPMAPGMPPGPAAPHQMPAGPQMTPQGIASGFTLAQYRERGWTDDMLRANQIIY